MWRLEPEAVGWLVVFSLQLRSLCSRQPACDSGLSFIVPSPGTWAADDSSGCFLLWSLGPLLTSASLFTILADYGRGRRTAIGLLRVAVASPCLTHLALELLQPASAPSQNWWLWPLASAVLVITNQDAAEVTAVQASVLYTASVTCAALDFARRTGHVVSAAAVPEASQLRPGPLPLLAARVLALAALHVGLAVSGPGVAAARRWRALGAGPGTGQRRGLQQRQQEQRQASIALGQADRRHGHQGSTAVRGEPGIAPGGGAAGAETAAWEGQRAAPIRVGAMGFPPMGVCAVHPQSLSDTAMSSGRGDGVEPAAQIPAAAAAEGAQSVVETGAHHQPTWAALPKQHEVPGLLSAPRHGWHSDFAAERRHVVSTRLADVALLAYDFLEAYRCFCGVVAAAAPPPALPSLLRSGAAGGKGLAAGAAPPPGALLGLTLGSGPGSGSGSGSRLRQLRCLGALLVTSWGATVLLMNAIIIMWPRPRRSQYAWVLNCVCSWMAGLARATLLVVLAPAAAWVRAPAAPGTDLAAVAGAGGVSGAGSLPSGQPALAAVILLLTHLLASNMPPRALNAQAAVAVTAGALLHRHLAPASPAPALAVVYGGIWLAAVTLSYLLARACRESQARNGLAAASPLPQQHRPVQLQLPPWPQPSGAAAAPAVAIAGGGGGSRAEDPLAAVASPAHGDAPIWRVLRPPRLGRIVSRNFSGSADGTSPGAAAAAAAASDLALRTLARTASPRLSSRGRPHLKPPRALTGGVSPCAAPTGEGHQLQCPNSRPGALGPQGPYVPGAIPRSGHGRIGGPAAPAAASFGLGMQAAGRPASGEPAPPRRPQLPPPVPPPAAPASQRTSLDSQATRMHGPPCRTASLDPRYLPCTPSGPGPAELTMAAVMSFTEGGGGAAKYPNTACSPPGRLSRCEKALDTVAAAAAAAAAAAEEEVECVSYMRRASSERPTGPERPVAAPTPSQLQQASSSGPLHAGVPLGQGAREALPAALVGAAMVAAGVSHGVQQRGGTGAWRTTGTQPWPVPPMATAAAACRTSAASQAAYGSGGAGGEELGAIAGAASAMGPSVPLAMLLSPSGPVQSGGGAAAANEHSVLSSVILEADMYDRLLSSASSPFLLNPSNATPTRRLPSVANLGTMPLPSPPDRRGQLHHQHQPPPQQQHLQQQPFYARTSSGLSEAWSAFAPSVGNALGTASGGGGAFVPGAIAAAGAAAGFGSHRQVSDGEDFELRTGDTGPRSGGGGGGGGGGGSESSWSRAATGSRSRLDRTAATLVAVAEEAPRQVIVLADGRQVYQSELLAAAASSSPPSSATPLRGPQALGAVPPPLSPLERPWTAAAADLLGPMARSETSGRSTAASAAATAAFQASGTAFARHLSYTARGGGGGGQSCSLDPLSSTPALQVPNSPRSGSGVYLGEAKHSAAREAGSHWAAAKAAAAAASKRSSPPAQSPWQSQVHLQRAVSMNVAAATPPSPSMYGSGGISAAAGAGRGDQGFGFGQPSLLGGSASGRSSYTTRGAGAGVGGTSASSRFSGSYGPGSGAGSASGAEFPVGGTSGPTSYGTAETGGSLSGGAAGSAGSGGGRGAGGAPPYHRASIDLGRHLHDTGLIRIGEEEAIVEDEDGECPASALFGTCDGDAAGVGSAAGPGFLFSGLSVGFGSESDRRSSTATDRPSGGTPSGDVPQVAARRDLPRWSYGSSSRGSGATGDATGSVPLAAAGLAAQVGGGQPGRARRSRARVSVAASPPPRHQDARAAPDAVAEPAAAGSTSGSSWSAAAPRSSADGPTGGGAGSTGQLIGSGASGASYRGLSDSPTLQTLLHTQSVTIASSSGLLPQLPLAAATAVAAAAAAASVGIAGVGGGGVSGGASGVSGGGAAAINLGRTLLSGGSHRSSSNPSLLSFADVTLGYNLTPSAPAAGPAHNTDSCSPGQSAAAAVLSGAGVIVTLARGVVAESSLNSAANTGGDGGGGAAAAAATRMARQQTAAAIAAAAAANASAGGAAPKGALAESVSVRFLTYPQTLASMAGSGSMGRGSQSALRASSAATVATAAAATSTASGAVPRGSYTNAASSSGRLGIVSGAAGDARAGSRPTIPELLASTAAAAAAIGNTPEYGAGAVAASPWASPASSAQLPAPVAAAAAAAATSTAVASGGAVGKHSSLRSYRLRLNLFTAEEGSSGGEGAAAAEGSCSIGAGSHPTADTNAAAGPRTASNPAMPSPPLPSGPLPSQPLSSGRRRGTSWFGQFLIPKRTSTLGTSGGGGGGGGGGGFLAEVPSSLPLPPPSPPQQHQHQYDRSPTVGEEVPERDGRASVAGKSSQQLARMMDDTARLSPVRGVLLGLRKRFRSGVKSLSGGRQ